MVTGRVMEVWIALMTDERFSLLCVCVCEA